MKSMKNLFKLLIILPIVSSCNYFTSLEHKVEDINKYEVASLNLAKENRQLHRHISDLRFRISELEAKNKFLELKNRKYVQGRTPASVKAIVADPDNDLVKFSTYNWSDVDLLKIARSELDKKNYAKAAQYFYTLTHEYPNSSLINDSVLFQMGLASFESKKYYNWANTSLSKLILEHPNSKYFRGAKLWRALTYLKKGNTNNFYNTVEEFRLKYRNTPEWKVLSKHYEELTQKYKN